MEAALAQAGEIRSKSESHAPAFKLLRANQKKLTNLQDLLEHETLSLRCSGMLGGSNKLQPEEKFSRN